MTIDEYKKAFAESERIKQEKLAIVKAEFEKEILDLSRQFLSSKPFFENGTIVKKNNEFFKVVKRTLVLFISDVDNQLPYYRYRVIKLTKKLVEKKGRNITELLLDNSCRVVNVNNNQSEY